MATLEVDHGHAGERAEHPVDPQVGERDHLVQPALRGYHEASFAAHS